MCVVTFVYSRLCVPQPFTPQTRRATGLCWDSSVAVQVHSREGMWEFRAHTEHVEGSLPWDCSWTEADHSEGIAGDWRVAVGMGRGQGMVIEPSGTQG